MLIDYKIRKEESPKHRIELIPCVGCQLLFLLFSGCFLKTTVLFIFSPARLQVDFVGFRPQGKKQKEMARHCLQSYHTCLCFFATPKSNLLNHERNPRGHIYVISSVCYKGWGFMPSQWQLKSQLKCLYSYITLSSDFCQTCETKKGQVLQWTNLRQNAGLLVWYSLGQQ